MSGSGGDKGSHLSQDDQGGVLAEESALAGHVRTGHDQNAVSIRLLRTIGLEAKRAIILHKCLAARTRQCLFDDRVSARLYLQSASAIYDGTDVFLLFSQLGKRAIKIDD